MKTTDYINIINSTFTNNYVANKTHASLNRYNGGAININGIPTAIITGCDFINNSAEDDGGAIGNNGNLTLSNNYFDNNSATMGGALYNNRIINLSNNTMIDNSANLGQMIYNNGTLDIINLTYIDGSTLNVTKRDNVTLYATLTDDMGNTITGQNITFVINNTEFISVMVIEGKAFYNYTANYGPGYVPVTGVYTGFTLSKTQIKNGQLLIQISTVIIVETNDKNITVTLKDNEDNILVGKEIIITVNGTDYNRTTDNNGQFIINYPDAWDYKVEAEFKGENEYFASTNSTKARTPTEINIESNDKNITVTLTDEDDNPIINKNITITVNGTDYKGTTNNNGQFTINYPDAWDNNITAEFKGNKDYAPSNNKADPRQATEITITTDAEKVVATLKDEDGNVLKDKELAININGKTLTGKTNEKGQVTFDYTDAWNYNVQGEFKGDDKYLPSEDSKDGRTKTITTIIVEEDKIIAIVTDIDGNPVEGAEVIFTIGGKVVGVGTTDANGIAIFFLKDANKNTITATFEGNEKYAESSTTYKPTVDPVDPVNPTEKDSINVEEIANASTMAKTGNPVALVLIVLIALFSTIGFRKRE
ncbi:hypothetical protein [Methanobrevibacter sp. DSM 116169]|uniref:hypothetical protein n=1 Tax=Methanobrevibacter sp. DSM 116169 TaxID=3242727 RepID=UPI0038FD1A2B